MLWSLLRTKREDRAHYIPHIAKRPEKRPFYHDDLNEKKDTNGKVLSLIGQQNQELTYQQKAFMSIWRCRLPVMFSIEQSSAG